MSSWRVQRTNVVVRLVAVVVLLAGLKLLSIGWFAGDGQEAYTAGRFQRSESAFAKLLPLNVVERWKAPNNLGVARFGAGDLAGAETAFRDALTIDPQRCEVRFNLVITIERRADQLAAAGRAGDAAARYAEALTLIDESNCPADVADREPRGTTALTTPGAATPDSAPLGKPLTSNPPKVPTTQPGGDPEDVPGAETTGSNSPGRQLERAGRRIDTKLDAQQEGVVTGDTGPPNDPGSPESAQSKRDVLEQRRIESNRQRHDAPAGLPAEVVPGTVAARW